MKKVKVVQKEETEIPTEVIAESIKSISDGIKKLRSGKLNDKALILLIQHSAPTFVGGSRVGMTEIRAVLDGIESLEKTYLRKKPTGN